MLTVLDSLKLSTEFLERKGIESPRLNAELLLAEILNCERLDLYLKFDLPLKESEVDRYRELITRRGKYEPLQYIIGKVEFYGLLFKVTPDVLIPRPETEILVEAILKKYSSSASVISIPTCRERNLKTNMELTDFSVAGLPRNDKINILDIGTGSGNIAITLAKFLNNPRIVAVDISNEALTIAKSNAELNDVSDRIQFLNHDIFQESRFNILNFDIIVSNPPYVSPFEYELLQKEIVEYEPRYSITDDEDGLKYYRRITKFASEHLIPDGSLYLEIGKGQAEDVKLIMEENGFSNIKIVKDYQQIDRVIIGIK